MTWKALLLLLVLAGGLVVGGYLWWPRAPREFALVGRYRLAAAEMTENGVIHFPDLLNTSAQPETVAMHAWDGTERWRITLPPAVDQTVDSKYGRFISGRGKAFSPNKRILAVRLMEADGGRVLVWEDGTLRADLHFPMKAGGLFDGKSSVRLFPQDDGRVFLCNSAFPTGAIVLVQDGRVAATGTHRSRQAGNPKVLRCSREISASGALTGYTQWFYKSGYDDQRCEENALIAVQGNRIVVTHRSLRLFPPRKKSGNQVLFNLDDIYFHEQMISPGGWKTIAWVAKSGCELQQRDSRLRVVSPRHRWTLPPSAGVGYVDAAVSANGRFAMISTDPEAPQMALLRKWVAGRLPGSRPYTQRPDLQLCTIYEAPGTIRARGLMPVSLRDEPKRDILRLPGEDVDINDQSISSKGSIMGLMGHNAQYLTPDGRFLVIEGRSRKKEDRQWEDEFFVFRCW